MHRQVGIIGSGIAGLLCASTLNEAGISCFVLDKGRGPGGRMATRYRGAFKWDHGAQYFTLQGERFQSIVIEWERLGLVQKWFDLKGVEGMGSTRYVGTNGINSIAQYLKKSLEVFQETRVDHLFYENTIWHLETEKGARFTCDELVCTQPIPQGISLLKSSGLFEGLRDGAMLDSVRYEKGLSTLVVLAGASAIPEPGCLRLKDGIIAWIADNSKKGLTSEHTCVTIQAQPDFAKEHWNSLDAVRGSLMIEAAKAYLGSEVTDFHCHRWGYAFAKNPLKATHIRDGALAISFAGDGFGKSRVESAALSGVLAAEEIIQSNKFLGS